MEVTEAMINHMARRFLAWKLPEHFNPDAGISFEPEFNKEWNAKQGNPPQRHQPTGTNLFDYEQAKAMVQHMVEGLPAPSSDSVVERDPDIDDRHLSEQFDHAERQANWLYARKIFCYAMALLERAINDEVAEAAEVERLSTAMRALEPRASSDGVVESLKPALKLLPIECRDTPDYAEATGPQFQAMTMVPEAFLALNALPDAIAALQSQPSSNEARLREALESEMIDHSASPPRDLNERDGEFWVAGYDKALSVLAALSNEGNG